MTFVQAGLLFLVVCLFLFLVAQALSSLSAEVKHLRGLIMAMIGDDKPKRLASGSDPIVHDAHSDNDEFESVTKQAERAWG